MKKDIIINVSGMETRIAIIEDDLLVEYHVERPEQGQGSLVGNIYKAKVLNMISGLKAAFVDLGMEKNGFLPLDEIPFQEFSDIFESEVEMDTAYRPEAIKLKENQETVVQVTKDAYGIKGPRVTSYISIPGRYIVLLINARNVGVSRKIRNRHEREMLLKIGREVRPHGMGLIIRTAAASAKPDELRNEVRYLKNEYEKSMHLAQKSAPLLVYREPDTMIKIVRDLFNHEVRNLIVDNDLKYRLIIDYLGKVSPRMRSRVKMYRDSEPIFARHGVEDQLKDIFERKLWLPGGGYIVIDQTEAFLAIDVNTGKSSRERQAEKLALFTNLEALKEVARQLRLRDIGGLVVVDLIDLEKKENVERMLREFKGMIHQDRARYRVGGISEFGLLQFTRERSRTSLTHQLGEACPICRGRGRILSKESMISNVERWFMNNAKTIKNKVIELRASPRVIDYLSLYHFDTLAKIGKEGNLIIRLKADYAVPEDDFKMLVT